MVSHAAAEVVPGGAAPVIGQTIAAGAWKVLPGGEREKTAAAVPAANERRRQ